MADGPGAMETIRIMRIEVLHTDLYTGPATEVDFIDRGRTPCLYIYSAGIHRPIDLQSQEYVRVMRETSCEKASHVEAFAPPHDYYYIHVWMAHIVVY